MEAGRELDALVGQHVFGYEIRPECVYGVEIDTVWYRPQGSTLFAADLPNYSTDIAAAWQVVEKMSELGWVYRSRNGDTPEWYVQFYDGENNADADADTAPLGICLAALKSVPAA